MKTIKVFLASSDELKDERMHVADLFNELNDIFLHRGLYLQLVKWEKLDSSMGPKHKQEEYNEELKTCEMCMVLYWTKLGEYTGEELTTAYSELKEGRNPRKLYVFFKEPGDITPDLQAFKESFATEYGHFYCKFENVDTMRLHFLLQLETYQNSQMKDVLKVEDSKVKVDGKAFVDLDKVPFAAKNRRYQELKTDIERIESEIRTFEGVLAAGPNPAIQDLLEKKRSERYYKKEELSEHENFLFNTAVRIVQQQGDRVSERMARAIQAFDDGRASDANAILEEALHDAKELRKEIAKTKELLKQQQESAAISISELVLKTSVTLADDKLPVERRIDAAQEIFKEAYALANESDYDRHKYMELLGKYGDFLGTYALYDEIGKIEQELLNLRLSVFGQNHPDVALSYSRLGLVYNCLGEHYKSLEYDGKALSLWMSIYFDNHPAVAMGYNNIGATLLRLGEYSEALKCFEKALDVTIATNGENDLCVAIIYCHIGSVYSSLGEYSKSLEYNEKALSIRLIVYGERHPDVAISYNNIGVAYRSLEEYSKSLEYHEKALSIRLIVYGERHPEVADSYNDIGIVYCSLEEYSKSLEYHEKALSIRLTFYGEHHPHVCDSYNSIAVSHYDHGEYSMALKYYIKCLKLGMRIYGKEHPMVVSVMGHVLTLTNLVIKSFFSRLFMRK